MKLLAKSATFTLPFLVLFSTWGRAQDAPPSQATAVISGTVIDAVTKQPLRTVDVHARNLSPGSASPHIGSSTTDAEGRFTLEELPAGRYFISAMHAGYVSQRITGGGSGGRLLIVGPDQHTTGVVVELTPGANISGHIKNADGKPIAGVSLEVVKYFYGDGAKQLRSVTAPSFSDAAGEYRITAVAPGQYYLRAVPPTQSHTDKAAAKDALAPTYYPNALDAATAAQLTVRPGGDLAGMDISFTPLHAVTVTGKIQILGASSAESGKQVTGVEVILISNDADSQREISADAKGAFKFETVPAGDYTLVARIEPASPKSKMLWGQRPLRVGDRDVSNADFHIGPGVQVNGRIHVDEKSNVDLTSINATLRAEGNSSVTALMPDVTGVTLRADGGFTFTDVPEGTHRLDFNPLPPGYFLKSSAAPDVLETGVTVSNSAAAIDLTLSPNPAQLTGTVSNAHMPANGAAVVLVPQGSRKGLDRFSRRSITDQSGHFSMKSVIPGDYRILAFEGVDRTLLMDPDFLQRFEDQGESMHLQEGDSLNVSLDAIPADESSP
jgi:Carboxypeptidase regulatory-like domain